MYIVSRLILFLSLLMFFVSASGAEIYKWTDEEGNVYYGDCPPVDCQAERIETLPGPSEEDVAEARERARRLIEEQKKKEAASKLESETKSDTKREQGEVKQRWAAECFSSPAELIGLKKANPFDPISPRLLTSKEHSIVSRMLRQLEGRWQGDLEEIICLDTEYVPYTEMLRYKVDAKAVRDFSGPLIIESDILRIDAGIQHLQFHWLLLKEDWLRFGDTDSGEHDLSQWDIEPVAIDKGLLVFIRKFRRLGHRGISLQHLELRSLQVSPRSYILREWFYVQGYLTGKRTWTLKK